MKKLQLLLCLFLFSTACIPAQQTFSITPNPVFGETIDGYIEEGRAMVKNLTDSTQNLRWKRTVIRLDNDSICFTAVTDPYNHWFHAVSERSFSLEPDQEGPLYVTLFDFEQSGCCAIVNMKIKNLDEPTDSIETYYYLRTCQTLAVSDIQKATVQISPNPVGQYFSLQNAELVGRMTICDANGKMLRRMQANTGNHYEIADFPSGAYYLILENKEGSIVQVLQWTKI